MRRCAFSASTGAVSARPTRFDGSTTCGDFLPCGRRFLRRNRTLRPGGAARKVRRGGPAGDGRGSSRAMTTFVRVGAIVGRVSARRLRGLRAGTGCRACRWRRRERFAHHRIRSAGRGRENFDRRELPHALHDPGRGRPRVHRELCAHRLSAAGHPGAPAHARTRFSPRSKPAGRCPQPISRPTRSMRSSSRPRRRRRPRRAADVRRSAGNATVAAAQTCQNRNSVDTGRGCPLHLRRFPGV